MDNALLPPLIQKLYERVHRDCGRAPDIFETHISLVLASADRVWKIKKPVDMGFLDYSALESRRHFCLREVELNRRLAPDIYEGVFPLYDTSNFRVGDTPISARDVDASNNADEYAVVMKRLPDEARFRTRLDNGQLTPTHLDYLAEKMAAFHDAHIMPASCPWGTSEQFHFNMEENFAQMASYVPAIFDANMFEAVRHAERIDFARTSALIDARRARHKLVDGHGDLHLEHAYWIDNQVSIIDCLEFSDRFRVADRVNDIAFAAMDLVHKKAPKLAHRLIRHYAAYTDDFELLSLVDTYRAYFAVVRAKINAIMSVQHAQSVEIDSVKSFAREYFSLAHHFLSPPANAARLVLICGMIGSGKSTVASSMADHYGGIVISSDIVRKHMAGIPPYEKHEAALDADIYKPEMTQKTYQGLLARAAYLLDQGKTVFVDASFSNKNQRAPFIDLAQNKNAPVALALISCQREEALQRLNARARSTHRISDSHVELYDPLASRFEAPTPDENIEILRINTTGRRPNEWEESPPPIA